jgi:LysR family transcriptional regulator for metE and metH
MKKFIMFEIKHLKTLATLASTGNIRKAAEELFSSQSALSHQIKDLESRLNAPLFIRNSSPVEFTVAGTVLLNLAKEILPKIEDANHLLKAPSQQKKTLRLAVACHACFQWLLPVVSNFSSNSLLKNASKNSTNPISNKQQVNVEFIDENFSQSSAVKTSQGKSTEGIDILFTDENIAGDGFTYQEIGQFEVVAVSPKQQLLSVNPNYLIPQDFETLTLLTYPLPSEQLDIFKLFLTPAKVEPAKIKQVNSSHVMLQMVSANMGIATLPDWLVSSLTQQSLIQSYRLGEKGVFKTLYARYQIKSDQLAAIEELIPQAITAFGKLYSINT